MKKIRENAFQIITAACLVCVHILLIVFLKIRIPYLLDSDMASEMILGKILSNENRILTDSWFYSTELRVINSQLIYALLFRITDSWYAVRLASCAVLHLILTLSTLFMCIRLGLGKYSFAAALFMLLPLSVTYVYIVITGCYYVFSLAFMFVYTGLCMAYMNGSRRVRITVTAVSAVIAFITGLGGVRQIFTTYLPLLTALTVSLTVYFFRDGPEKCRKSDEASVFVFSFISFISAAAGFLINSQVLSEMYSFRQFNKITFRTFRLERAVAVLNDMLVSLGYTEQLLSLSSLVSNLICALLVVMTVWSTVCGFRRQAGREYRIFAMFFVSSFVLFVLLYAMTDMDYTGRYNIPVTVLVFPLIFFGLKEGTFGRAPVQTRTAAVYLTVALMLTRGFVTMYSARTINRTGELVYAAEFLKDSDYRNGYATFWNANVLTELTDGCEEMYAWRPSDGGKNFANVSSPDDLFGWLQKTEHTVSPPEGKVFALYTPAEKEFCTWADSLREEDIVYSTDGITIYGYENYSSMMDILNQKG